MPTYPTLELLAANNNGGFYYLASPYSNPDELIRESRARAVYGIHAYLLSKGIFSYSPILAAHPASLDYDLPKDHLFWWKFNLAFMLPAIAMLIAPIPGYDSSKGIDAEVEYFRNAGKPIYLLDIDHNCARLLEPNETLSKLD